MQQSPKYIFMEFKTVDEIYVYFLNVELKIFIFFYSINTDTSKIKEKIFAYKYHKFYY